MTTTVDMDPIVTIHGLSNSCKHLISKMGVTNFDLKFDDLGHSKLRFTALNLPTTGQWEDNFRRLYGDKLSYNDYNFHYPRFCNGITVRNATLFPSCKRILKFEDPEVSFLQETIIYPVINPENESQCLVVNYDMAKFMFTCIDKALIHLQSIFTHTN